MGWFKNSSKQQATTTSNNRTSNVTKTAIAALSPKNSYASAGKPVRVQQQLDAAIPDVRLDTVDHNNNNNLVMHRNGNAGPDSGLMVVDQPPMASAHDHHNQNHYDVTPEISQSYSRDGELDQVEMGSTKQNHLNSLFNGHLMKWKFEAEEGSGFIRIPAFFMGLGLIGTAIAALVLEDGTWSASFIVMSVCVILMAIFILILDGRFLATNPLSARAHIRNIMTKNFNMFRFLWGRGLLYIAAGVLSCANVKLITMISGAVAIVIGVIALCVGIYSSRKFAALRNSLADESFLLLVFSNYDSDGDGYISPNQFALLIQDLGMELDDRYTLKAFSVMDTDNDRRISFDEFSHWWASGYIERGRRRRSSSDMVEEEDYHRME